MKWFFVPLTLTSDPAKFKIFPTWERSWRRDQIDTGEAKLSLYQRTSDLYRPAVLNTFSRPKNLEKSRVRGLMLTPQFFKLTMTFPFFAVSSFGHGSSYVWKFWYMARIGFTSYPGCHGKKNRIGKPTRQKWKYHGQPGKILFHNVALFENRYYSLSRVSQQRKKTLWKHQFYNVDHITLLQ